MKYSICREIEGNGSDVWLGMCYEDSHLTVKQILWLGEIGIRKVVSTDKVVVATLMDGASGEETTDNPIGKTVKTRVPGLVTYFNYKEKRTSLTAEGDRMEVRTPFIRRYDDNEMRHDEFIRPDHPELPLRVERL